MTPLENLRVLVYAAYDHLRHPIEAYRYWYVCIWARPEEVAEVYRASMSCPDCIGTDGYCDYHEGAYHKVFHDEHGYVPLVGGDSE